MCTWLAPVLAQVVSLSAGDRTEARARVDQSVVRYDAETLGWVALDATAERTTFDLGYALLLSSLGIGDSDQEFLALHSQFLGLTVRFRRTLLSFQQAASYGEQNFRALSVRPRTALASRSQAQTSTPDGDRPELAEPGPRVGVGGTTPPAEAQPILIDRAVRTGSVVGAAGISSLLSRRLEGTAYAGYDYAGGLDDLARLVYPVYYGPFASLGISYRLTPIDRLSTFLTGRRSTNLEGQNASSLVLEERWSRRFSENLDGELGLGVSAIDSDVEPEGSSLPPFLPTGFAALAYRSRLALQVSVTTATLFVTPGLDRLTGIIDQRAELRLEQRWSDGDFDLLGALTGSQSLTTVGFGLTTIGAEGIAAWRFAPLLAVDAGLRGFWQKYAELDALYAYALFVGLRVSTE
jgi:hypothetical protein